MSLDIDLMVACILYVITGILQILITIMLCMNLYGSKRNKRLSPRIRRSALLFAISCCLRMIFLVIHYIGLGIHNITYSSMIENGDETYDLIISDWAGMATDVFLLTSKIMLYWHLITRLKVTYKDSIYYPSNLILNTLRIFLALIIIITLILCVFFIIYIFNELPVLTNNISSTIFLVIVMSILMVSDFVISSLILYSFINGLYQLIISLKQTVLMNEVGVESLQKELFIDEEYVNAVAQFNASIDDDTLSEFNGETKLSIGNVSRSSQVSESSVFGGVEFIDMRKAKSMLKQASKSMCTQQEKLIETITKNTLLTSIAIGSTFIFLVFRIIILILKENNLIALIYSIFGSIDTTLDLCVIYLNFAFAKQWYIRICFKCDDWCLNKCTNCAERGVYNANKTKYLYGMDEIDNSYHALV